MRIYVGHAVKGNEEKSLGGKEIPEWNMFMKKRRKHETSLHFGYRIVISMICCDAIWSVDDMVGRCHHNYKLLTFPHHMLNNFALCEKKNNNKRMSRESLTADDSMRILYFFVVLLLSSK